MPTEKKNSGARVGLLDELRGFAIICMVVYHAMFDLKYLFGVNVPIFFDDWFDIVQTIFAGLFIFISGTVCRYSRNNLKRGVQCFFRHFTFSGNFNDDFRLKRKTFRQTACFGGIYPVHIAVQRYLLR